jgi:hypothetical protein
MPEAAQKEIFSFGNMYFICQINKDCKTSMKFNAKMQINLNK